MQGIPLMKLKTFLTWLCEDLSRNLITRPLIWSHWHSNKFFGKWNAKKLPQLCITLELLMTGRWYKPSLLKLVSFLLFLLLPLPLTMLQCGKLLMSKQSQHSTSLVIYSLSHQSDQPTTSSKCHNFADKQWGTTWRSQSYGYCLDAKKNPEKKLNYESFFG